MMVWELILFVMWAMWTIRFIVAIIANRREWVTNRETDFYLLFLAFFYFAIEVSGYIDWSFLFYQVTSQ